MAEITHKDTRELLFELKGEDFVTTVTMAVKGGVNLSRASLYKADLRGCDLSGANLSGANLSEANLSKVNFQRATLIGANLEGANLIGANLFATNFKEANLKYTNLEEANLENIYLFKTNLEVANLTGTELIKVNLDGANLTGANLTLVDLTEASLRNAIIVHTKLDNTNFKDVILGGTVFGLTDLSLCENLETVDIKQDIVIDLKTIRNSQNLPKLFLNKIGLSETILDYVNEFTNDSVFKMFPVFLSHSSEDKEIARKIYDELIENNVHCWFDEKMNKPGDRIIKNINEGINKYDKMILICSKASLTSTWVQREIERILDKEKKYNHGKKVKDRVSLLIPIMIDNYVLGEWDDPWAEDVKKLIIGDFKEWKDAPSFEVEIKKLVEALRVNPFDFNPISHIRKP